MICSNCKNGIEEGMIFCPFCGKELSKKEENVEETSVSDTNKTNAIFPEKSLELPVLFSMSENIICPNCENDIKKGMIFCPFCGEKILRKKENIEEISVSDTNETGENFQAESLESSTLSSPNEASAVFQKESPETEIVPTPNKFENINKNQEKDWTDKKFSDRTPMQKIAIIVSFFILGAVIYLAWYGWGPESYDYKINHIIYDEASEYVTKTMNKLANNVEIAKYKKKYIYHTDQGNYVDYSDYTDTEGVGKAFYEYCTITLPIEYTNIYDKRIEDEFQLEFHVYQPTSEGIFRSTENLHVINLTQLKLVEAVDNLNNLGVDLGEDFMETWYEHDAPTNNTNINDSYLGESVEPSYEHDTPTNNTNINDSYLGELVKPSYEEFLGVWCAEGSDITIHINKFAGDSGGYYIYIDCPTDYAKGKTWYLDSEGYDSSLGGIPYTGSIEYWDEMDDDDYMYEYETENISGILYYQNDYIIWDDYYEDTGKSLKFYKL